MGLLESLYRLKFQVDTADARKEIKELSGDEKKAAQARLDGMNEVNRAVDDQIKKFKSYKDAIGDITGYVKAGFDAIEFAGKRADLASAAAGVSIEQLRKATFGLRTDTELLTTAAKLNHSVFSLTQNDMNVAAKAMTALGERGGDAEEAINAVTEALVTGKTKGLKQFGIEVDETKNKAEKYRDIMQQLAKVSGEVSDSSFDASDKVSMLKVSFRNTIDQLKDSIGSLLTSLTPLLELIAKAVGLVADAVSSARLYNTIQPMLADRNATVGGQVMGQLTLGIDQNLRAQTDALIHRVPAGIDLSAAVAGAGRGGKKGSTGGSGPAVDEEARYQAMVERLWAEAGFDTRYVDVDSLRAPESEKPDYTAAEEGLKSLQESFAAVGKEYNSRDSRYAAFNAKKEGSFLEGTFGKLSEFDAYKEAFSALSGAVGSSLSAWIDGSMSAGAAFKKFIADALKGLAVQLAVESLKHGAYALGSLAFGDVAGAAKHGLAAAEFALAAGAAAVGAKALGVGASQPPGRGASAPNVSGSGAAAPQQQSGPIIVYGDQFADDSPRSRQLQAEKMVQRAIGNSYVNKS